MTAPHPAPSGDLFDGLWQAAHWIWERRLTARQAGFPFSEETITETVLLDLATAYPGQITILPFNKVQEGKIGADWEWCLYDRAAGRYLRMLLQAKVLDDRERAYSHVDRLVGNTGRRQIDVLARTSVARGVPAFYVFYNHISNLARIDPGRCQCVMGCAPCWGATIAPLDAVRASLPDKTFDTLQPFMTPWACLLCPPQPGDPAIPRRETVIDRVLAALTNLETRAAPLRAAIDEDFVQPRIESEAPDYLDAAVFAVEHGEPDELAEKLAARNPELDGVVLIDVAAPDPRRGQG